MVNKKHVIYNQYLKTCGRISSEMVGVNFGPEWRYLIYKYSSVIKIKLSC